ncbi:hypothetical protein L288_15545 [Sphingobium quisquiliarum P25]|uniref:Rieske domain-containing protein n=1 Tax=Sphingobium quisquiliarum P25 TaxID=1329909 RepID=T0HUA0_9SPHN|nr:Rieske 2Fe-2S domain-containing protein [Sphingobium quisquiliarum]EQB02845.1 hypothetical protein L288_15545 [Sphingobium quisquiliarum P25]
MYPFQGEKSFVANRWYVAAVSDEITRTPIERTLLDLPVLLYRAEDGSPVAMYGLCPHRYFPLVKGQLVGDAIQCGYHGFTFDKSGKCVFIPTQNSGSGYTQRTFPVVEKAPFVWIWMGDAELADESLIVDYAAIGLSQPGWTHPRPIHLHLKGRYQLLIDNLMDLTHVAFIHKQIGGSEAFANAKVIYEEADGCFKATRPLAMPWTSYHDFLYGPEARFEGMSQTESRTVFFGPEYITTSGPVTVSIEGYDTVPEGLGRLFFHHVITPETEHSTHYFGTTSREFRLDDPALDEMLREADLDVRTQDVEAIDAIEARLEKAAARERELLVRSDTAAVKVRGIIQAMLDREAA